MNVLERYIGKTILSFILLSLFMLVGLGAVIKFVEEFRNVGIGHYDVLHAAYYTILTIPRDVEAIFPIAALLGALLGLGNLAARSELTVMQSAGFSRFRIGLAVMKTAIPLVIFTMIIGEWGVPQTEQFARNMRSIAQNGGTMLATHNGFWAKDNDQFIYINRVNSDTQLHRILIYQFTHQTLFSIRQAESAEFTTSGWIMKNVNTALLSPTGISTHHDAEQQWHTNITPDKLRVVSLKPESLSITGLADYVGFLRETGQDTKRFEITFWRKIYQPISMAIMMLLAISFIFGPLRSSTTGAKSLIGICVGFLFYVANIVFGNLSLVFAWLPVYVGTLMPSLVCLFVIWWLLTKKRD